MRLTDRCLLVQVVSFVVFDRQPSRFVNPSARFTTTIPVTLSFTEIFTDFNGTVPLFFNVTSTHQLPLHVSRLAYSALKAGNGVGVNVGNGVKVGVGVGGGVKPAGAKLDLSTLHTFPIPSKIQIPNQGCGYTNSYWSGRGHTPGRIHQPITRPPYHRLCPGHCGNWSALKH